MRQCPGCNIILPLQQNLPYEGNFAYYGVASPECLALLNKLLVKEYEYGRPMLACFDAYAVHHPPHKEFQEKLDVSPHYVAASKQSVAIHLIALYLILEKKLPVQQVSSLMNRIFSSGVSLENEALIPPENSGDLTVADIIKSKSKEEYIQLVWLWSQSGWNAWSKYHSKVKEWYEQQKLNEQTIKNRSYSA